MSFEPWLESFGAVWGKMGQTIVLYLVGLPIHGWHKDSIWSAPRGYGDVVKVANKLEKKV